MNKTGILIDIIVFIAVISAIMPNSSSFVEPVELDEQQKLVDTPHYTVFK